QPLELLDQLGSQTVLQLLDGAPVDLLEALAAGLVQGGGPHLLEKLADHAADAHDLRRLLDELRHRPVLVLTVLAVATVLPFDGDTLGSDNHALGGVLLSVHASQPSSREEPQRTSNIFPMCFPSSSIRWARAASGSGTVAWTTGRIVPAATRGQTFSTTPRTMAPFSSTGRDRRAVAWIVPRLARRAPRSTSPFLPPCIPMITIRPPVARALTFGPRYFAPMMSKITSARIFSEKSSMR